MSWVDGSCARLPVGWADLAVLLDKLEGLEDSKGLLGGTANWQIVDDGVTNSATWVNQEKTTKGDSTSGINQNTIVSGDLFRKIGQDWVVDATETAGLNSKQDLNP